MGQLRGFVLLYELIVDFLNSEREDIVFDIFILSEQRSQHLILLVIGVWGLLWTLLSYNDSLGFVVNNLALLSEMSALLVLSALFTVTCFDIASFELAFIRRVRLEFDIFVFFELDGWCWVIDAADVVWV
jgi:hypothetical protein